MAALARRSPPDVRALSSHSPTAHPASTNPAQGNSVKVVAPAAGRRYRSSGSGSTASRPALRTTGVSMAAAAAAAASSSARGRPWRARAQSAAAATIDTPMTLRMSTLRIVCSPPPLMSHACIRNSNASPRICQPRRRARATASASVRPARILAPAASASDTPARKRKIGAPPIPPTNVIHWCAVRSRPAADVHASMTCPWIMTTTPAPRSQSR